MHSENKTLPLKPSSKLVALKQKEESNKKERETPSAVTKEKIISGKEEKRTPKKQKVSPQKPEVGTFHEEFTRAWC